MEDQRGSVFAAGVPRHILLMAWFAFAYRAVEVALMGAARGEVAEISGGGRRTRDGRRYKGIGRIPAFTEGGCFGLGSR